MGAQRLRAGLRRLPPLGRPACRHPRAPRRLHGRPRHLLRRLASLRPGVGRHVAHRRPRPPGARRGDGHAVCALDPDHDLHRGSRAQHRARGLGRGRRLRRRGRRPRGRDPHRSPLLGVDLLRQHPRWRRRARPLPDAALTRAGTRTGSRTTSPARSWSPRALLLLVLGITQGRQWEWLSAQTIGVFAAAAVLLGRSSAWEQPAAGAARAVLHLPAADAHRSERRRPVHGHGDVLDVAVPHPVHAAGARALRRSRPGSATSRSPARRSSGRMSRHKL